MHVTLYWDNSSIRRKCPWLRSWLVEPLLKEPTPGHGSGSWHPLEDERARAPESLLGVWLRGTSYPQTHTGMKRQRVNIEGHDH
jgi:hypothetical protein